jgi:hypothetical protein
VENGKANAPAPNVGLLAAIAVSLGMWALLYFAATGVWVRMAYDRDLARRPGASESVAVERQSVPQLASLTDYAQVKLPTQTGRRPKNTQRRQHGPSFAARAFSRSSL